MKDFDEINPDDIEGEPESRLLKWMSVLILILAIGGFFALAWYAYHTGTTQEEVAQVQESLELVKADNAPIKEAPDDPGGQQFPHQDKTVFNAISGNEKPQVERILPASEEPVEREPKSETETWMNDRLTKKTDAVTPAATEPETNPNGEEVIAAKPEQADEEPKVPATQFDPSSVRPAEVAANEQEGPAPAETTTTVPPVPVTTPTREMLVSPVKTETKEVEPATVTKEEVAVKPEVKKEEKKEPKETKEVKETVQSPVQDTTLTGSKRVQLGAFKSQDEAEQNWDRIKGKYAAKLGGREHRVIRVDLGAKGIFYRLHVMPFTSVSAAQSFCSSIAPQPCFAVTGK